MSLLKNIDIWKGNRPRVCNFDLDDYCVDGLVGNNTTGLNGIQANQLDPEDILISAAATGDAYMKTINEIVLATLGHYVNDENYDGNPFPGCITEAEWNGIWDFLNGPDGPYLKHRDYVIQRSLFFNSLMPTRLKRTDTATYQTRLNVRPYQGPNSTVDIPFTVDYSTALYPTLQTYKNYTKSVRDLTQSVKRFLQALDKDTFPIYQP